MLPWFLRNSIDALVSTKICWAPLATSNFNSLKSKVVFEQLKFCNIDFLTRKNLARYNRVLVVAEVVISRTYCRRTRIYTKGIQNERSHEQIGLECQRYTLIPPTAVNSTSRNVNMVAPVTSGSVSVSASVSVSLRCR